MSNVFTVCDALTPPVRILKKHKNVRFVEPVVIKSYDGMFGLAVGWSSDRLGCTLVVEKWEDDTRSDNLVFGIDKWTAFSGSETIMQAIDDSFKNINVDKRLLIAKDLICFLNGRDVVINRESVVCTFSEWQDFKRNSRLFVVCPKCNLQVECQDVLFSFARHYFKEHQNFV